MPFVTDHQPTLWGVVLCRLYPGLLQHAAAAHIATAVTQERVSSAEVALTLLRAAPTTCEALLLQSVSHVLLGDFQAAAAAVKAAARWGHGLCTHAPGLLA